MTRDQVVRVMGEPESSAASNEHETILRYTLRDFNQAMYGGTDEYFVRMVDGKVHSWGKMGDFDSTKDPTLNLNIKRR